MPISKAGVLRVTEHYLCVEGEGSTLGALTYLIRLSGCDLRCWWCDSKFSSFREDEARELGLAALERAARQSGAAWVSFTGGEPTWRSETELASVARLAQALRRRGLKVKVESNGRHRPKALEGRVDLWSLAPKWDSKARAQTTAMRYDLDELKARAAAAKPGGLQWKFVITQAQGGPNAFDLQEAARLLKALGPPGRRFPAFFIPEAYAAGDYAERCRALEAAVASLAAKRLKGWDLRVQPQWHRVLHGDSRGK